ncbi:MAG: type IV pilus twitching motility protein PilT [Planctomycetota bacterium]
MLGSSPEVPGTSLLRKAREEGASDLHLAAGAVPMIRVEGELRRLAAPPLAPQEADEILAQLLAWGGVEAGRDVDFCFERGELGRFRANAHRHARGAGLSLKCVPREIPTLEQLGLPDALYELTELRTGMVLVTGPANCGKSSTLAALLRRINSTRREHVVTIEDPIEFVFPSEACNVTQRQVGPHTRSFSSALRAALREDPDVILVSELRDVETIRTAIVAAETGHLVLGTLHTRDAASTVSRLLDVFPAREQEQVRMMVAASLRSVISQRLLPRAGGGRRVPAYEILHVTPAVATLIRDGRTHQIPSQLQIGRRQGMIDMDARLEEMVREGLIDGATARASAKSPARFPEAPRAD